MDALKAQSRRASRKKGWGVSLLLGSWKMRGWEGRVFQVEGTAAVKEAGMFQEQMGAG